MFANFFKPKQATVCGSTERFFSVAISETNVQAALWQVDQNVKVLAKSNLKSYENERDLLVQLDGCLQELGEEGEAVHQTLFHLDSAFVSGQELSKQQTEFFTRITTALQLESLGFVTNTEAVINARLALNPEFGKQLVVEFTKSKVVFSLYEQKRLLESLAQDLQTDFAGQLKAALVQLAGHLGADYASCFQPPQELSPEADEPAALFINYISLSLSSEELGKIIAQLPEALPARNEILGSEILLNYILLPSATIISRSLGLLPKDEEELTPASASEPPLERVETPEEPPLVLSRQKLAQANQAVAHAGENMTADEPAATTLEPALVKKIAILGVILGVTVATLLGFYLYLRRARVQVILAPKTSVLSKSLEVVIDPKASKADYENFVLPGELKEVSITHTVELATTGKKDLGDPAKGKVEIINTKTEQVHLKKGLEIENGVLSFALDEDVTLEPAKRKDDNSGIDFSKKTVGVTANTKGKAGNNIKKGASLRVGSYAKEVIEAVAVEDFSGGMEKLVSVYSSDDEKKALATLDEELPAQVSKQINPREGNSYVTPQLGKIKITKTSASLKVGDEGETVKVEAVAKVPVIVYQLSELEPLATAFLDKELQPGWEFNQSTPEILSGENAAKTAQAEGKIYLDVDLSRGVVRQIDKDLILHEILGQKLTKVNNYLQANDALKSYQLIWSSQLAAKLLGKLPSNVNQVQLSTP